MRRRDINASLWPLCSRLFAERRAARRRRDWADVAVLDAELASLTAQLVTVRVRLARRG